jgi:hypothetical protein
MTMTKLANSDTFLKKRIDRTKDSEAHSESTNTLCTCRVYNHRMSLCTVKRIGL